MKWLMISLLALLLSACTVHIISNENGSMVNQLQQIQQQINTLLITDLQNFKAKNLTRTSAAKKYISIQVSMTDMISTAKAIVNNETTTKQLIVLQKSILQLISLRKKGFSSTAEIKLLITTINSDFTSVYQLQDIKRAYLKTGVMQ